MARPYRRRLLATGEKPTRGVSPRLTSIATARAQKVSRRGTAPQTHLPTRLPLSADAHRHHMLPVVVDQRNNLVLPLDAVHHHPRYATDAGIARR